MYFDLCFVVFYIVVRCYDMILSGCIMILRALIDDGMCSSLYDASPVSSIFWPHGLLYILIASSRMHGSFGCVDSVVIV